MPENPGQAEEGGGENEILRTGLADGSTGNGPNELSSCVGFSVAVDEFEESFGEESLGGGEFFVDGDVGFSWSVDVETRLRRAFSFARLGVGRQRNSGDETMEGTCSETKPIGGTTRRVSTRRGRGTGGGRT